MAATFGFINFEDFSMTQDTTTNVAADAPATKNDGGKPRMDLVAPEAIFAMAWVLEFGARKYAERNWEKGMAWGRVYAAVQRHLHQWAMRVEQDPESGLPHLWHALCGLHFLVTYDIRGVGDDDRAMVLPFDADNANDEEVEYDVVAVEQMDLICKADPDLADDADEDKGGYDASKGTYYKSYRSYIRDRLDELN